MINQAKYKNPKAANVEIDKDTFNLTIEEQEDQNLFFDNSNVNQDFQVFIENCKNIDTEVDILLVHQFLTLLSQNSSLPFGLIINTNFIHSITSKLYKSQSPDDTIVLLKALKILMSNIDYPKEYLIKFIAPLLTSIINFFIKSIAPFLNSIITVSDKKIVEISLDCLLFISNNNIMNLFFIRIYKQEGQMQADEYIQNLWNILLYFLPDYSSKDSINICQMIIQIFGTFCSNIEQEIIKIVFNKLKSLIVDSYYYSFLALENIEKFSNYSPLNLKIMAQCHGILSIQNFLLTVQSEYEDKKVELADLITELKKVNSERSEIIQKIELFEKGKFSTSNFLDFLTNEIQNNFYLASFQQINQRMNEITAAESISMNILFNFVINSNFNDLDSSLLLKLIKNFDYQRNIGLAINTLKFMKEVIKCFNPFQSLFLDDTSLFQLLINFSIFSTFSIRIEAGYLITQLIRIANRSYLSKLIEFKIIGSVIQLIGEIQNVDLFSELCESLCKLIDMNFGKLILQDLLGVIDSIKEMSNESEEATVAANILIKKIEKLENMSAEQNMNAE